MSNVTPDNAQKPKSKGTLLRIETAGDIPEDKLENIRTLLSLDPRPSYQHDPERIYGLSYGGLNIRFRVEDGLLTVTSVEKER